MDKMDKQILAVPSSRVEKITKAALANDGLFLFTNDSEYKDVLKHAVMKRRGDLENDTNYKQIIPYLVLKNGNTIFYYIRSNTGSESRLLDKLSIGIGGHIEVEDIEKAEEAIDVALQREIQEEIGGTVQIKNIHPLGFIFTEKTEVDTVHIGVLFTGEFTNANVIASEEEIGQTGFASAEEFQAIFDNPDHSVESWTQIAWNKAREKLLPKNDYARVNAKLD